VGLVISVYGEVGPQGSKRHIGNGVMKSAPKKRVTWPDRRPDVDKMVRSTLDALVQVGAIEDDARVIECLSRKVFPKEHKDALDVPGAVIRVHSVLDVSTLKERAGAA
jgi:hypothetical protein